MHFCKSFYTKFKARTTALPDPPKVKNHTTTSFQSVDVIAIISRQIIQAEAGGYVCTHERERERERDVLNDDLVE